MFDFIIVVPLLCYLFVIRKRYSLKYVWLVALASIALAMLVIPNEHLAHYPFVKYLFFAGEGAFIFVELFLIIHLVRKLPRIINTIEKIESIHAYDGPEKLTRAEQKHLFDAVLVDFLREKPAFEIKWRAPINAKYLYGFSKQITKVHVTVDNNQLFYETINRTNERRSDYQLIGVAFLIK